MLAKANTVTPSGPPLEAFILRSGKQHRILRCPGGNGAPCVKPGGSWLKGRDVCVPCTERATIWDGMVPADAAREHIKWLSKQGVGYKSVADACCIGHYAIRKILGGQPRIRATTEQQILSVDAGAKPDHAFVSSKAADHLIRLLIQRGFRKVQIAHLLGAHTQGLQIGRNGVILLSTEKKIFNLVKKVNRGEVVPKSWGDPADVQVVMRRGVLLPPITSIDYDQVNHFLMELKELRSQPALPVRRTNEGTILLSQFHA